MAIDTRQKRMSMLNLAGGCDGSTIHVLFEADGAVDNDDRAHLLDLYSGIPLDAPSAAPDIGGFYIAMFRHRRRTQGRAGK